MKTVAAMLLVVALLLPAPRAEASETFWPSAIAMTVGIPIGVFALTTTFGASLNDRSRPWYTTGYVAGSASLTTGILLMALKQDPDGVNGAMFWTGLSGAIMGLIALGTAIDNHLREPAPPSVPEYGVIPVVLQAPATGDHAPGLGLTGRF